MEIGRSRCITLPAEFAKELKIEKGEEVYIDLAGNIMVVGKLDTVKEKEPIRDILKFLSDVIKIRAKLDEDLKAYARGDLSDFELISKVGEIRKCLTEIGSSVRSLSKEKIQPMKKKLDLKFMETKTSADDMIAGVEALMTEGYEKNLNALCSEMVHLIEQRKTLGKALQKIDKTNQEYGTQGAKSLTLIKLESKQKKDPNDGTLGKIKSLVETTC